MPPLSPQDESNHAADCASSQALRVLSMDIIMVFLQFFYIILHELCSAVIAQHLSRVFAASHTKGIAAIAAQIFTAPCAVAYYPLLRVIVASRVHAGCCGGCKSRSLLALAVNSHLRCITCRRGECRNIIFRRHFLVFRTCEIVQIHF